MLGGLVNWRANLGETRKFAIHAGCFVRLKDAVIPTLKLDYNTYSFTMSYDVTTSSLNPSLSSVGGWEFSLFVRGKYARRDNVMDRVRCPQFEQGLMSGFEGE